MHTLERLSACVSFGLCLGVPVPMRVLLFLCSNHLCLVPNLGARVQTLTAQMGTGHWKTEVQALHAHGSKRRCDDKYLLPNSTALPRPVKRPSQGSGGGLGEGRGCFVCDRQMAPSMVHEPLKPEGPHAATSASSTSPSLSSRRRPTCPAVCVSLHAVCPFNPHP